MRARPRSARARTEGNNRRALTPKECAGSARARYARSAVPIPERKRSFRSALKLVARTKEPGGDDEERRDEADEDPDTASAPAEELVGNADQPDEHEDGRERA